MNLVPFALGFARSHWKLLAGAALLLALIAQTFRLQATEGALTAEKAGRAADRSSYERAQAEASANALSNKLKVEAENAQKADQADQRYTDLSQQYRAAVLRYQAAQGRASKTDLPGTTEGPAISNGPGGPAVIPQGSILIPQADALICSDNTARLEAVREWSLSLSPQSPQ